MTAVKEGWLDAEGLEGEARAQDKHITKELQKRLDKKQARADSENIDVALEQVQNAKVWFEEKPPDEWQGWATFERRGMTLAGSTSDARLAIVKNLELDARHKWCWLAVMYGIAVGNIKLLEKTGGAQLMCVKAARRLSLTVHFSDRFQRHHASVVNLLRGTSPKWKITDDVSKFKAVKQTKMAIITEKDKRSAEFRGQKFTFTAPAAMQRLTKVDYNLMTSIGQIDPLLSTPSK